MAGTMLSQAIPMAVLLVLTRIVPAADIGNFSLLISAATISSIIAAASLDKAIFSAHTEADIVKLLRLTIVTSGVVGLVILIAISVLQASGLYPINPTIAKYSVAFVAYALFMALSRNLQAVLTYRSQFWLLSKAKILFATPAALAQLGAGLLGWGVSGLIYSTTVISAISTLISMKWLNMSWKKIWEGNSIAAIKKTFISNHRFVIISLPADLIGSASGQLPIFIIAARFGSVSVAMYALVLRVLSIPVGLLGNSVLTVFKDQAGQDYREQGNCVDIYLKTLKNLVLLAFFPFLGLHLFGAPIVKFLLGDQWIVAGQYAEILAPMLFVAFISSPLSYVLYFSKQGQTVDLCCQVALTLIICLAFSRTDNISHAILYYSIFGSIYYIFYLLVSYRAASGIYSKQPI